MTFIAAPGNPPGTGNPVFDYSSRDYASVYQDLLNRIPVYLPQWTSRSPNDFGIALLQMFAYCVDSLHYYLDRLAGEAFLSTAAQPQSVLNIASMLDYQPKLSAASTVTLQLTLASNLTGSYTVPALTQFATVGSAAKSPIVFETNAAVTIPGTTAATPQYVVTVGATQGITFTSEAVATSNGIVNQVYPLLHNPVIDGSWTVYVDQGLGPQPWTDVTHLIDYGPNDQVYTTFSDANGVFYILFGDNVNGLVPALGSPITCTYRVGGGSVGNVGANTIIQPVTAQIGVTCTNPAAATGGTDAESISSIRTKAPASLRALNRGVTLADINALAVQISGVRFASAEEATYQLINLYIAPTSGGNPPSPLITTVQNYMDGLVMANTTVTVQNPTYVDINVSVALTVASTYGNLAVENSATAALQTLLGFPNTGFGLTISEALLLQTLMNIPGVQNVVISTFNRSPLAFLSSALTNGSPYTSLSVTPLPQAVNSGDSIVLNPGTSPTQTVTASSSAAAGATSISVTSFNANANYAIGVGIQDTTVIEDCICLTNEIPVQGSLSVTVSGGIPGS